MNFSRSFAVKCALACVAALTVVGCGPRDGVRERAEGTRAFEAGDYVKAGKLLARALEYAPGSVETLVKLAQVKMALGELPAAKQYIDTALQVGGEATDVTMLAAQIAYHLKDYDRATKLFNALATDRTLAASLRADAFVGHGVVAMTANRNDTARVDFLKAIRLDRRNAAAYYHLGLLYRNALGYTAAALDQFEKFAYLGDAADARVQKVQRVIIRDLKDDLTRQAKSRPGASRRDSASCAATLVKAEAAYKKNGTKAAREAVALYQKALAADPLSYPAAVGLAKAHQKADTTKDGLLKSLEAYKIACALKPSSAQAFLTVGALAVRLGFTAQAVEAYSRALAADETNLSALDGYIRALQKVNGRRAEAAVYQGYRDFLDAVRKSEKKK